MPYVQSIVLLDEETVLAECGPMRITIKAWKGGAPQTELCQQAAKESFTYLERIARWRYTLSIPAKKIRSLPDDDLALRMIKNAKAIGDPDLTPMAAVAGTIADATADWLYNHGATKVVVDNGGDIAIRLSGNENVTVGVRPKINSLDLSHVIALDSQRTSWGVTPSGLGGRSFTKGIASAVTTIAENASVADTAATAIANACFVEDSSIVQIPAEQLDPNTDLKGVKVTVKIGALTKEKKSLAVKQALRKADYLSEQGIITGAVIALEGIFVITNGLEGFITPTN